MRLFCTLCIELGLETMNRIINEVHSFIHTSTYFEIRLRWETCKAQYASAFWCFVGRCHKGWQRSLRQLFLVLTIGMFAKGKQNEMEKMRNLDLQNGLTLCKKVQFWSKNPFYVFFINSWFLNFCAPKNAQKSKKYEIFFSIFTLKI